MGEVSGFIAKSTNLTGNMISDFFRFNYGMLKVEQD